MGGILSALLILIFVSAQGSLMNLVPIDGVVPDLALVFLVLLSLRQNKSQTYLLAIWAGLLQDVLFYPAIGSSIAAKLLICYLIIDYGKKLFNENIYYGAMILFFSVFTHEVIMYMMLSFSGYTEYSIFWYMQNRLAPFLIYNLIIMLIMYKPLAKFLKNTNFYDI